MGVLQILVPLAASTSRGWLVARIGVSRANKGQGVRRTLVLSMDCFQTALDHASVAPGRQPNGERPVDYSKSLIGH